MAFFCFITVNTWQFYWSGKGGSSLHPCRSGKKKPGLWYNMHWLTYKLDLIIGRHVLYEFSQYYIITILYMKVKIALIVMIHGPENWYPGIEQLTSQKQPSSISLSLPLSHFLSLSPPCLSLLLSLFHSTEQEGFWAFKLNTIYPMVLNSCDFF